MKTAPTIFPATAASMDHPNDSPKTVGPSAPVTTVSNVMLVLNQTLKRSLTRP